jgi:adenylate kinase
MSPTYIVLIGPPGVGKGTQAKIIAEKTGLPHVSSGDLFRENIRKQTEMGKLVQTYINKGNLVPDDITISMIQKRLTEQDCSHGALLDGFPRTPTQASALEKMLVEFQGKVNHVPYITASSETLIERLSGRLTCRKQGHVFHDKNNPPKVAGVCDFDGSELYLRDDDKKETVERRIQVYFELTCPLIEYYRQRGLLVEISGARPIEEVTSDLLALLGCKKE